MQPNLEANSWIFYYLTSAYQNLEKAKLKVNIIGSVYFLIVNEWKFSKTKVEDYILYIINLVHPV